MTSRPSDEGSSTQGLPRSHLGEPGGVGGWPSARVPGGSSSCAPPWPARSERRRLRAGAVLRPPLSPAEPSSNNVERSNRDEAGDCGAPARSCRQRGARGRPADARGVRWSWGPNVVATDREQPVLNLRRQRPPHEEAEVAHCRAQAVPPMVRAPDGDSFRRPPADRRAVVVERLPSVTNPSTAVEVRDGGATVDMSESLC